MHLPNTYKFYPIVFFLSLLFMTTMGTARSEQVPARGLFVWALEDVPVLSSQEKIDQLIEFAVKYHIKTLFVQVYRNNRSYFPSQVADPTPYEENLKRLSQDPFPLLIKKAHKNGIEVHAWMNMLSLGSNKDALMLKKYGPSILTRNIEVKKSLEDYKIDNQYFLEPSDNRVREELLTLVVELLKAYPALDGIQFDYIRYPDVHPFYGYSKDNVERFKKKAHVKIILEDNPKWKQWKRDQVTELLQKLVKKARSIRPHIHISTTGCIPYIRAYHEALQDWPAWINKHLIEFVTVMNYPPDVPTFKKNIDEIEVQVKSLSRVNIAVGAYKPAQTVQDFKGQLESCEESKARACVLFHYDDLVRKPNFAHELQRQ